MARVTDTKAGEREAGRVASGAVAPSAAAPAPRSSAARAQSPAADWRTASFYELCDAFLSLRTRDEVEAFLRDLCTLSELDALSHRLAVARLVREGLPYLAIAEQVGASTTTVTRVAHWLRHGAGGYELVLARAGAAGAP
jgi:TrpR-related protein YerC/YecD